METQIHARNTRKQTRGMRLHQSSWLLMGLVALFACWSVLTPYAHAQVLQKDLAFEPVESFVSVPVMAEIGLEDLSTTDLSNMSSAWWKSLIKQHARLLRSSDEQRKAQALKNLIFFAKTYPETGRFKHATSRLYKIYRSDENEAYRIMALAALHAIGDERIMERFREDVSVEKSERVRRYTLYALADYYKNRSAP